MDTITKPWAPPLDERRGADGALEALPIHLVDLGKARGKAIKQLKKGGGKLHKAIVEAIGQIEAELGRDAVGKTVLPVVVLVERKRKKKRGTLAALL